MKNMVLVFFFCILLFSLSICNVLAFELESNVFKDGGFIPIKYTGLGEDVSPPLKWKDAPDATLEFALICDDPDAPKKGSWVHWVIYNMPMQTNGLPEGVQAVEVLSDGTKQGINDFKKIGYKGPYPPPGKPHRYYFRLYSLDIKLDLKEGATKEELLTAMEGHILDEVNLIGKFQR